MNSLGAIDAPTRGPGAASMGSFADWSASVQSRMEAVLARRLPLADKPPQRLHQAMRYATLEGGKRVRPLLAFAAGVVTDAPAERLEAVAAAVEMIHAYSLVHDDMPCMDDDVLRRGKPTVHVEFDEATALLAGDSLQTLAFEIVSQPGALGEPAVQLEIVHQLAVASGTRGMAGGQAIDLAAVGQALTLPELELMHIHKTGALIRAAVRMGALCGRAVDAHALERLDHYAKCVGLAFQVVDDVLDADANTATLGKTAGKDAVQGKPTYVSLMGLAQAKDLAERLCVDAHASLESLAPRAQRLHELADFIVRRKF